MSCDTDVEKFRRTHRRSISSPAERRKANDSDISKSKATGGCLDFLESFLTYVPPKTINRPNHGDITSSHTDSKKVPFELVCTSHEVSNNSGHGTEEEEKMGNLMTDDNFLSALRMPVAIENSPYTVDSSQRGSIDMNSRCSSCDMNSRRSSFDTNSKRGSFDTNSHCGSLDELRRYSRSRILFSSQNSDPNGFTLESVLSSLGMWGAEDEEKHNNIHRRSISCHRRSTSDPTQIKLPAVTTLHNEAPSASTSSITPKCGAGVQNFMDAFLFSVCARAPPFKSRPETPEVNDVSFSTDEDVVWHFINEALASSIQAKEEQNEEQPEFNSQVSYDQTGGLKRKGSKKKERAEPEEIMSLQEDAAERRAATRLTDEQIREFALQYNFTENQILEMEEAFQVFDIDANGVITVNELGTVMMALGQRPSLKELEALIQGVDTDNSGTVDFGEFLSMMGKQLLMDPEQELREIFSVFDCDGDGVISCDELYGVLSKLDHTITREEVTGMIAEADVNGDGVVDFSEFKGILHAK